ncbi:predicted protein [Uncinocarpus reesii 1704]|uniref:Uncharacterized protein n=1 Tax=Uncinocarpus reesii (strain UAMH 1704) TaxID=336963 RepID=C4K000_UNCRE|nr:uncharacterized protein UREG_07751 [Uncinocarpus reesii 1704]EEP82886.1 predicted protein [Uncinocarpus reesii 1704]
MGPDNFVTSRLLDKEPHQNNNNRDGQRIKRPLQPPPKDPLTMIAAGLIVRQLKAGDLLEALVFDSDNINIQTRVATIPLQQALLSGPVDPAADHPSRPCRINLRMNPSPPPPRHRPDPTFPLTAQSTITAALDPAPSGQHNLTVAVSRWNTSILRIDPVRSTNPHSLRPRSPVLICQTTVWPSKLTSVRPGTPDLCQTNPSAFLRRNRGSRAGTVPKTTAGPERSGLFVPFI